MQLSGAESKPRAYKFGRAITKVQAMLQSHAPHAPAANAHSGFFARISVLSEGWGKKSNWLGEGWSGRGGAGGRGFVAGVEDKVKRLAGIENNGEKAQSPRVLGIYTAKAMYICTVMHCFIVLYIRV